VGTVKFFSKLLINKKEPMFLLETDKATICYVFESSKSTCLLTQAFKSCNRQDKDEFSVAMHLSDIYSPYCLQLFTLKTQKCKKLF